MTLTGQLRPPLAGTGVRLGGIHQISISNGGVPKSPVPGSELTRDGLLGDGQRNLRYHGGPDKAVCLWSAEVIDALREEGHSPSPGSTGENLTVGGIDWTLVRPGVVIMIGETIQLQITEFTRPCRTNAQWFRDGDFRRMSERHHPGWSRVYARVIVSGVVYVGDRVAVTPRLGS